MLKQLLPWLTSIVTLWSMYVIGNRKWYGWLIGLFNQVLWIATAVMFAEWGLLPLSACLTVLYVRNLIQWKRT